MEHWLELAKGPFFRFSFLLMALGMLRLLALQVWTVITARRGAGDKSFPRNNIIKLTLDWMIPVNRMHRLRPAQGVASFIFHAGMILVPLFFIEHVALWNKGAGFSWMGFPKTVADPLTIITMISLIALIIVRLTDRNSRFISRAFDYGALVLLFVVFITGFFSSHPALSPIPYNIALLGHILSAEFVLVMIPFTKLAHAALFPVIRVSSEIGWKFVPDAGEKVTAALGKEGRV